MRRIGKAIVWFIGGLLSIGIGIGLPFLGLSWLEQSTTGILSWVFAIPAGLLLLAGGIMLLLVCLNTLTILITGHELH